MNKLIASYFWGIQDVKRMIFTIRLVVFMMVLQGLLHISSDVISISTFLPPLIILCELLLFWMIGLNILRRSVNVGLAWPWSFLAVVPYVNYVFYLYLILKPSRADSAPHTA